MCRGKISIFFIALLLLSGCETQQTKRYETVADMMRAQQKAYVDFEKFKEGRPCAEVKFMCLPESQDKSWQSIATSDHIEDLELTPEVEMKYKKIAKQWNKDYDDYHSKPHPKGEKQPMLITSLDKDFFDKVQERRFLEEMEQELEKEFPGFWKETPKKVRYRWIRRAMKKAKKFGHKSKKPGSMIELCARIGLDFDKNPKWNYITNFIKKDPQDNISLSINYIDWTIFNKTHARTGTRITDWLMRRAHPGLPNPKKPYPKLHP